MSTTPAYTELTAIHTRLYHFRHLSSLAWWDRNTMMPPKGNEARAAAEAELHVLMHQIRTDPRLAELIIRADDEPLDDVERANLREIRRNWRMANAVPAALVQARTVAGARCEHAWRRQRPANDWAGFLENFREVVRLAREEARLQAADTGVSPYEALMDHFEPGMTSAELDRVFGELRQWLPDLLGKVSEKQRGEVVIAPQGPFPAEIQRKVSHALMRLLGFDFEAGRLDESIHPFSGGSPEDVRLTTRYEADDFARSLRSTLHETGHGRYEQNLPRAWLGQPIGTARSLGIHESQSLFMEMQIGRGRPFIGLLTPLLSAHYGEHPAFAADNLRRLFTRVAPGFIRTASDEVTYPLHVILRYEIERALIDGEIEADDIPTLWDEKMMQMLDLNTRGNYRDGCLQDVHWADGTFGYFPSYTLGALYAAQWYAALRRAVPDVEARIAERNLQPVFDWLNVNIWSQASRWETPELALRASGESLNPAHFRAHLERRYLGD